MAVRLLALVVLAVALSGCGSSGGGSGSAGDALAYLPADAATVILVSTDVDGEQWEQFGEHVLPQLVGEDVHGDEARSLEEEGERLADEVGLDWQDDVKPLLGNDIAAAIEGDPVGLLGGDGETAMTGALSTSGGDIQEVLEKADFERDGEANGATIYTGPGSSSVAVEDGVLVFAPDEAGLRRALERQESGEGLDQEAVDAALADLPTDTLARAFGSLDPLTDEEELRRFASLPLVQALETWGLTVGFGRAICTPICRWG